MLVSSLVVVVVGERMVGGSGIVFRSLIIFIKIVFILLFLHRTKINTIIITSSISNIVLVCQIYIPDGLGGFMDALSDPRAFLSAQDKRAQQLAALGIQESDIGTDIIEGLPKVNAKQATAFNLSSNNRIGIMFVI